MHNVRKVIQLSSDYLEKRGISNPRRQAEELLAALLKKKRIELYFDYDAPLEERELETFREWIKRRGEKEPIGYILGEVPFLNLKLKVSRKVLIPRQESEILAAYILKRLPGRELKIWDLCTGSGCLGLSIKAARPESSVSLSDLSLEALEIARFNAAQNQLDVEIFQGDLLEPFSGKRTDVLICNPPYVESKAYETLEDEVRLYEPKLALVGGESFYRRLHQELPDFLNPGAQIFFEIGEKQKEALDRLFSEPHWKAKHFEPDWAGLDRFFFLEYHPDSK